MQIPASTSLSSIIKHYLIIKYGSSDPKDYRFFSDGNPGIVLHLRNPLMQYSAWDKKKIIQPASFIYGQTSSYSQLKADGEIEMLVIVLQPYALYALFGEASLELKDNIVNLDELLGREAKYLQDQVCTSKNSRDRIREIEAFMLTRISNIRYPDQIVVNAINLLHRYKGAITIENLASKLSITGRQLERKFLIYVGYTPKRYASIIKFQNFLKLLQKLPADQNISNAIYEAGYYDQPHLNNYFKRNVGLTPSQYKASYNLHTINFLQDIQWQ